MLLQANYRPTALLLLIVMQTLFMIINMAFVSIAPLMGQQLFENSHLATLPIALSMFVMLLCSFPVSYAMARWGRKPLILLGLLAQVVAALFFFIAILSMNVLSVLIACLFFGFAMANANFYRFYAMELVPSGQQAQALARFMFAGVLAAVIGPNLAIFSESIGFERDFAGTMLSFVPLSVLAIAMLLFLKQPKNMLASPASAVANTMQSKRANRSGKIAWGIAQPIIAATIAYVVMIAIMSATALHMHHQQFDFAQTVWVIQWHVLGMFAPSLLLPWLLKKWQLKALLLLGSVCLIAASLLNIITEGLFALTLALALLGIGWNFVFVGSSHWLMQFITSGNRAFLQGLNEVVVFGFSAVATFASAALLSALQWSGLNIIAIALLLPLLIMLMFSQSFTNSD